MPRQLGFRLTKDDGREAKESDITDIEQKLDLWTGTIHSRFRFKGETVYVQTTVHPYVDMLAIRVESKLVEEKHLTIILKFPYGSPSMQASDWTQPGRHKTKMGMSGNVAQIGRWLDDDKYQVRLIWANGTLEQQSEHQFSLRPTGAGSMDFHAFFSKERHPVITDFDKTADSTKRFWESFWTSGGAIELSDSRDPRAKELERRVILSQYLTAIQCSGSRPPQETGLTTNSWYGKYHLEMHWWHAAQFALWNRFPLLDRSLDWYNDVLPSAKARATEQGYKGARWAKMTEPSGRDSPSPVGTLLIWQ